MTYYEPAYLDRIVDDCFMGRRGRTCQTCPAHHSKGGPCCFGDPELHDPDGDEECRECQFVYECNQDAHKEANRISTGYSKYTSGTKQVGSKTIVRPVGSTTARILRSSTPPKVGGRQDLVQLKKSSVQPAKGRGMVATSIDYEDMEGSLFNRFIRASATGALQGTFEMAADFWRNHHL